MIKQFEITGKCNLRCEACYNLELMKKLKDIEISDVLRNISKDDVVYIGGGEPMLHPKIQELCEKLIEAQTEIVVATNSIIYKKMPKQIQIQSTIWTLNPELYRKILGGTEKQLEKAKENIERYISDGNPVFLNMPVYDKNLSEIKNISDYAFCLGIPLRVNPIFPVNGFENDSDLERKIETCVFELKLNGRNIIYSKNKVPVKRFYAKN